MNISRQFNGENNLNWIINPVAIYEEIFINNNYI